MVIGIKGKRYLKGQWFYDIFVVLKITILYINEFHECNLVKSFHFIFVLFKEKMCSKPRSELDQDYKPSV